MKFERVERQTPSLCFVPKAKEIKNFRKISEFSKISTVPTLGGAIAPPAPPQPRRFCCGVTQNFAHCLGCTHDHVAMVLTTGHNKMVAQSVNTCAPKAVSKILGDTADGENFGTNGRNYQTR